MISREFVWRPNKGIHLLLIKADSFECEKFSVLNSELHFGNDVHGRGRKT